MSGHNFEPPTEQLYPATPIATPPEQHTPDLKFDDLTTSTKRFIKGIKKLATWILVPLFMAQTLAFGSFIYEEALQAAGFAARSAMIAGDQGIALESCKTFEDVMASAARYQHRYGHWAFWTHGAFDTYFTVAAPRQLFGYYVEGKKQGLWEKADIFIKWGPEEMRAGVSFVNTWRPIVTNTEPECELEDANQWEPCKLCEQQRRQTKR